MLDVGTLSYSLLLIVLSKIKRKTINGSQNEFNYASYFNIETNINAS